MRNFQNAFETRKRSFVNAFSICMIVPLNDLYDTTCIPVGTRYCGDIGFLLDLHRDIDQLRIEIEVTSLYDIFFQHHNDVVAIT